MKSPFLPFLVLAVLAVFAAPGARADDAMKGIRIFELKELDQLPVPTLRVAPEYPQDMHNLEISGQVIVDFIVDANGDVQNATPFSSTQYRFEDKAVQAVSQWKFRPGQWHGHAVASHVRIPIKFTLLDRDKNPTH